MNHVFFIRSQSIYGLHQEGRLTFDVMFRHRAHVSIISMNEYNIVLYVSIFLQTKWVLLDCAFLLQLFISKYVN